MITKRDAVIYVSDSGPSTKKFHGLMPACMREAFFQLMRHYRKSMDEEKFQDFSDTNEFQSERLDVAKAIREGFHKSQASIKQPPVEQ